MYYPTTQTNASTIGPSNIMTSRVVSSANSSPRDSSKLLGTRRPRTSRPRHASAPSSPVHSAPIRLPKTHIHRTPSELQLAQELLKADHCERQMYARLVYGMSHHCERKESEMHPLTVKSIQGVVHTHNHQGSVPDSLLEHEATPESDDWEVCYQDHEEANSRSSFVSNDEEEEDDCVFDLEM